MCPGKARAGRIPGSLLPRLSQKHRHTYPRNPGQGWAPRKLGQRFPHILVWPGYLLSTPAPASIPYPNSKFKSLKSQGPMPRPLSHGPPTTATRHQPCIWPNVPSHHRSLTSQEARVSDVLPFREGDVEAEVNKYLSLTNSGFLDLPTGTQ